MEEGRESLIIRKSKFARSPSHAYDELQSFRSYLRWMCVDQSSLPVTCLSWIMFLLFGLVVPAVSHFLLGCSSCDARHERPYNTIVQLSLSSVATLSFVCLSEFVRKYGLRRFLFFDKLCDESETVRQGYTDQLNLLFPSASPFNRDNRGFLVQSFSIFAIPFFFCLYKNQAEGLSLILQILQNSSSI